jgi:hypothetical protein
MAMLTRTQMGNLVDVLQMLLAMNRIAYGYAVTFLPEGWGSGIEMHSRGMDSYFAGRVLSGSSKKHSQTCHAGDWSEIDMQACL